MHRTFQNHVALDSAWNYSLAWTPDGKRLFWSSNPDSTIQEWDTVRWKRVDGPWARKGHTVADAVSENYILAAGTDRKWLDWPVPDSLADFEACFRHRLLEWNMNVVHADPYYEHSNHSFRI
ncbi:hypothetical protein BDR04DRAFT_1107046 [Suillus decipiens]|nr:hypothetical protein BDR04DRAFT_1107046 [Suillus decipiens]